MTTPLLCQLPAGTHWLSARHRRSIVLAAARGLDCDREVLADVLAELSIVEARAATWGRRVTALRRIAGLEPDALPVRLTAAELAVVLRLPLDDDVARRLKDGAWDVTRPACEGAS